MEINKLAGLSRPAVHAETGEHALWSNFSVDVGFEVKRQKYPARAWGSNVTLQRKEQVERDAKITKRRDTSYLRARVKKNVDSKQATRKT